MFSIKRLIPPSSHEARGALHIRVRANIASTRHHMHIHTRASALTLVLGVRYTMLTTGASGCTTTSAVAAASAPAAGADSMRRWTHSAGLSRFTVRHAFAVQAAMRQAAGVYWFCSRCRWRTLESASSVRMSSSTLCGEITSTWGEYSVCVCVENQQQPMWREGK